LAWALKGRLGRNAERRQRDEEVAGYRQPHGPNKVGCGGPQQIVPAALLGGSVNVKTLTFPTEVPDVRLSLG
jgi:hypothetical protein